MKLDSARSLKLEIFRSPMWRLVAAARRAEVRRPTALAPPPVAVPIAMGLKGRRGAYRLALRVHRAAPGVDAVVNDVMRRARGEVDVRVVGRVAKQVPWHQARQRPLRIGSSVGHERITAGTLGAFVTPRAGDGTEDLILSNNHVLADENRAARGDRILQPGRADGGRLSTDVVGELASFVPLKKKKNVVDAAIASLAEGLEYYVNWLHRLGPITGIRLDPPDEAEVVYKIGRTTGLTKGRISAIEIDALHVEYDDGVFTFDDQIEIEPEGTKPFSLGGDSGSLIVDARRRAVALLFAGNDVDATYASPIGTVLDALKVRLVY